MEPISSTSFLKVNISGADDSTGEMVESSEFSVRGRGTLSADTDGADDNEEAFVDFPSTHRRMSLASSDGARDVGPNGGVSHSEISKCHENMVRNQPGPNVHLTMDPAAYLANKSGDNDKHAHVKISTLTGHQNEATKKPGDSVQMKSTLDIKHDPGMEFEKPSNWVDDEEESDKESVAPLDVLGKPTNCAHGKGNGHEKVVGQYAAPPASRNQDSVKKFSIIDRQAALAHWALMNSSQQPQHS
jgi:hypothetical protein